MTHHRMMNEHHVLSLTICMMNGRHALIIDGNIFYI